MDKRGEMALDDPIGDGQQADNIQTYTVTELSGSIKRTIEDAYGMVRVRGELSKVTRPPSGHIYFDLKDEKSVLASVVWKTNALRLRVKPEQGLEVICTGRLTTFGPQSKYQLIVEHMAPAGMGALMALLEERKQKLSAEGLFAPERKVKLPFLPRVIGVVTSPTGAVIRDILHRLGDRFPRHVIVWPTLVQGDKAAGEIVAAIEGFNRLPVGGPIPRPDVLIVARGGGSIEDLWPFNEEIVVRAAAASEIPLISAVGHETDTTLIDFAADVRAPTPTAAAEMAVPVRADLLGSVIELDRRIVGAMERKLTREDDKMRGLARALPRLEDLLAVPAQRFDHASVNLGRCMAAYVERKALTLAGTAGRLRGETYLSLLDRHVARIAEMGARLDGAVQHRIDRAGERLAARGGLLEVLSHKRTLERGFALVERGDGGLVRHASEVTAGDELRLTFADGSVPATVTGAAPEEGRPRRTKGAAKPTPEDQGRLI